RSAKRKRDSVQPRGITAATVRLIRSSSSCRVLPMNQSLLATLGFGFLLGLKHATEADHLVAVSTIVSESRYIWHAAGVGALWGVGHTASLLVGGFFVIALGVTVPARIANLLELAVALMIIFLGTRLLYVMLRARPDFHVHAHTHSGKQHIHLHFHD